MRQCTRCNEDKQPEDYYIIQRRWLANICKACTIAAKVIKKRDNYSTSEDFRWRTKCWNAGVSTKNRPKLTGK